MTRHRENATVISAAARKVMTYGLSAWYGPLLMLFVCLVMEVVLVWMSIEELLWWMLVWIRKMEQIPSVFVLDDSGCKKQYQHHNHCGRKRAPRSRKARPRNTPNSQTDLRAYSSITAKVVRIPVYMQVRMRVVHGGRRLPRFVLAAKTEMRLQLVPRPRGCI